MLPEIPTEEFRAALDECAEQVLWEAGVARPPVDALLVAERLGLQVARDETLAHRGRIVRLGKDDSGTILVAREDRPERTQWTVAHEIGESVAYRVFARLEIPVAAIPERSREMVANRLASCLLLPRRWFLDEGRRADWDLLALKQNFATASHELIARRMLEMLVPVVITLCDQGRVVWRYENSCQRPPPMCEGETQAWQAAHRSGCFQSKRLDPMACGLEQVRCWAIHEPGWKREILRGAIAQL